MIFRLCNCMTYRPHKVITWNQLRCSKIQNLAHTKSFAYKILHRQNLAHITFFVYKILSRADHWNPIHADNIHNRIKQFNIYTTLLNLNSLIYLTFSFSFTLISHFLLFAITSTTKLDIVSACSDTCILNWICHYFSPIYNIFSWLCVFSWLL